MLETEITRYDKISCDSHWCCVIYYYGLSYNKDVFFIFILGGSNENGSTHHTSDADGTFISYRLVIFYIYFIILKILTLISSRKKQRTGLCILKVFYNLNCNSQ